MLQAAGGYSGGGTDIKQYDLTAGIEQYAGTDELHYKLLDFISRIAGSYISYIDTLNVWTDGLSYQLGAAYFSSDGDNRTFTVRMDINDIFDKDGNYRNAHKTLQTFVHEFGHVLTLNAAQVDLSKQPDDKFYYVYDSFKEGSYLKAFCDAFWKPLASDDGEELYKNNPSLFVDEYASTNSNEDIAESFMLFVLSNRPTGSSIAEAKIDFFYNYPELVQLRDQIRANFGYEK
ncbi:hypothetical protein SDC9_137512 [bioreactor metagenome]|uniref:Uncharacterized protein n=1 Tax=bioreactor metagenome TaxID=1076179 RepID=A0A645DMB1_9ZZZZ